jgi:hypothetical protein
MCMSVMAHGENAVGEKFKFWAKTLSVSLHGGLMITDESLIVGQQLHLTNEYSGKKAQARIVSVGRERDGQVQAAFEFVEGGEKFWGMVFPAAGAKPLRRAGSRREAAG